LRSHSSGASSCRPVPRIARRPCGSPTNAPRTLRLTLSYDGSEYHGWQVQADARTVQGCLIDAAHKLVGDAIRVIGASRTDAGVHALGQVCSLVTTSTLSASSVRTALNALLPADIRVLSATDAERPFDARRSARGKRYGYVIDDGLIAMPLMLRYAWHVGAPLDVGAMRAALRRLRGRHDFSAFCAAPGRARDPRCTLRAVHVVRKKRLVALFLSADSFLHHMVRNIVGSAVEVGLGRREPEWMARVLEQRDRALAGPTVPAHGLVLLRVMYPRRQ
jgi:tRNA pseudouridine38-40 synthase